MTSFLTYKQSKTQKPAPVVPIVETTVPDHLQHHAENWDHHSEISDETHQKIAEAMGGYGKTFTHFPLPNDNHHDIDPDVAEHLTKHNYQVKDYAKGIVTTKKIVGDPDRGIPHREKEVQEKIGSVLEKTGASDDVKKSFMNDPARAATKSFTNGGHHIVITNSALGIAGMSTGTSWKDQSCMRMDSGSDGRAGSKSHMLSHDSEHGTHVAYLVHHDDHEAFANGTPSKPIARIALKPYHEEEDDHHSDTIFRPETTTYGAGSTKFEQAVHSWAREKFSAKPGTEYTKNSSVYDDSDNTKYQSVSKEDIGEAVEKGHALVERSGQAVDKDVIDHAIDHAKKTIFKNGDEKSKQTALENLSEIGNLNTMHVSTLNGLSKQHGLSNWGLSVKHGDKFSSAAMADHIERRGDNIPNKMLMNSKLPPEVVDKLEPSKYGFVRRSLIKPHHVDKVVDNYTKNGSGSFYDLRDHADRLTKDHLTKIIDSGTDRHSTSAYSLIMSHKEFTHDHHDKLVAHAAAYGGAIDNANLMKGSKFASPKDAKLLHTGLTPLTKNENLHPDYAKEIKDTLVKNASKVDGRGEREIEGFHRSGSISDRISKHMTDDDFKSLAQSGRRLHFENPEHSEKHLDELHKLVKKADEKLDDHVHDNEDEHGDSEADEKSEELKEKLDKHVAHYASNIDSHMEAHAIDGGGYIAHNGHADKVQDHLDNIESLNHYATENNNPHSLHTDADHYFGHVQEIHENLGNAKRKSEDRDNGDGDDNWH